MAKIELDAEAVSGSRTTIGGWAGKFGAIGDRLADQPTRGDMFGDLTSSSDLARAVGRFSEQAAAEFTAAESVLKAVERTLDSAEQNITAVDDNASKRFAAAHR